VPAAGPADPVSFDLANRLTGNVARAGALELTGGGTRLRCLDRCHVAVVGACATEVDTSSPVEMRVVPGPHAELFAADALTRLAAADFMVEAASNRVGLRLRAEAGGGA